MNGFGHQPHNLTTGATLHSCGNSATEAKSLGCKYDIFLNNWLPAPCYDEEWITEYRDDNSWGAYADEKLTQRLTPAEMEDGRDFYYTSLRDHINHCALMWNKQFWALYEERSALDTVIASPRHTEHCAQFLIDARDVDERQATKTYMRATKVVRDALEAAGRLPPAPFPFKTLSGAVRKPDVHELRVVLDLRHFADCCLHMYRHWELQDSRGNSGRGWPPDDDPEHQKRAQLRFHRATYRALLAGAVLCRRFLEPLFLAPTDGPKDFLVPHFEPENRGYPVEPLTPEDMSYFKRFAVYNPDASMEDLEPSFGPLARFLLDDIQMHSDSDHVKVTPNRAKLFGTKEPLDSRQLSCLQDIVGFIFGFQEISEKSFKLGYDDNEENIYYGLVVPQIPQRARKVFVVQFGIFRPGRIYLPANVEDSSRCYLLTQRLDSSITSVPRAGCDIAGILDEIPDATGQTPSNMDPLYRLSPLLRFPQFMLRAFYGLDIGVTGILDWKYQFCAA
ncbi:hypothetical protein OQA88_3269 [Cercophora sp. LCS_1]